MKAWQILGLGPLLLMCGAVWGYGSSNSSKACAKPGFSQFYPPDKADVVPNAKFSFLASPNTRPDTIRVVVKDLSASIAVKPVPQGYQVSGMLPSALHGTFARINISAEGASQCKGSGGWLVNIGE
ncbi:hypothetical protein [Methylomicrobium lacus]|uniref:hypothetical protein n=1 Tax=Methylomicrobium lacus TaxID=136992 RepID=UPI0035A884A8